MENSTATTEQKNKQRFIQILALVIAIGVTVGVALLPIDWRQLDWEHIKIYGYPGLFVVTLLSDATVLIPFPGLAVVFLAGGFLNPILIGVVSGLGSALGELIGYLAGYGGRAVIENQKAYPRLERWMQRNGILTIFFLSVIPNPLFDMAGIMAGVLKMPAWKFLTACWVGKFIKFGLIAFAGGASIDFIKPYLGLA